MSISGRNESRRRVNVLLRLLLVIRICRHSSTVAGADIACRWAGESLLVYSGKLHLSKFGLIIAGLRAHFRVVVAFENRWYEVIFGFFS